MQQSKGSLGICREKSFDNEEATLWWVHKWLLQARCQEFRSEFGSGIYRQRMQNDY